MIVPQTRPDREANVSLEVAPQRRNNWTTSRVTTLGLVLVLIGISAFAIWSSWSLARIGERAIAASRLSDYYAAASSAVAAEESLERKYRLEPGPEVLSRYDTAAADLVLALGSASLAGNSYDRDVADRILSAHGPYLVAIKRMFAAGDRGDTAEVLRIDGAEVDPRFDAIEKAVDAEAARHHALAMEQMDELRVRGAGIARATPMVFLAGLLAVGLFSGVLRKIRLQLDRQRVRALHGSLYDALTGLPNRALLADRFEQALRTGRRDGSATGLLLIDLDRFKEINDTLGHQFGDRVLAQIGTRLAGAVPEMGTVARLGGDEFAVVLPAAEGIEGAIAVARLLGTTLAEPFDLDGVDLLVEASIGVVISGIHGDDSATLLQRADVAMYAAKNQGGGVAAYDVNSDQHTTERLALLGQLRRGMALGELFLDYQPKVSLCTGSVTGVEALVRWQHPLRGLVPPGEFIPIAEHTALIVPLTHFVLDTALAQARAWADAGHRIPVAVNISARNLLDESFARQVYELLRRHQIAGDLLELEVTESAIMLKPNTVSHVLHQLRDLGVRIAIDDFGAGYTSLGQLKNLPISGLKIDKSFVLNMHKHDVAVIVRSVIELGHNLGLSVVAEGVETAAAAIALSGYRCDIAQGYHLCRPLAPDAFLSWYKQRTSVSGGFIQARPKNRAPLHGVEKLCARPQVA
jgi:diguanylate cyclase (GGDEF)-like protein